MANLPKYVEMKIVNSTMEESRVEKVKDHYDFPPKYYKKKCMLQGHNKQKCKIQHKELK